MARGSIEHRTSRRGGRRVGGGKTVATVAWKENRKQKPGIDRNGDDDGAKSNRTIPLVISRPLTASPTRLLLCKYYPEPPTTSNNPSSISSYLHILPIRQPHISIYPVNHSYNGSSLPVPSSPSAGNSPSSDSGPQTPVSPSNSVKTLALPPPVDGVHTSPSTNNSTSSQSKRKPSRRANTAERRATHNAVERQRRETLNGRFLDLAALLPNLSQIRRPSKSSIVNSSIAHIHSSRRHRLMAARELRLLKLEADALRRELNEWRDRSGLPRVEEPIRGDSFQMILSGEATTTATTKFVGAPTGAGHVDDMAMDDIRNPVAHPGAAALLKEANPFAHSVPAGSRAYPDGHAEPLRHVVREPRHAIRVRAFSYPGVVLCAIHAAIGHARAPQHDADKVASWNAQMFGALANPSAAVQGQLFTPPASSHGNTSPMSGSQQQQAYLMSLQRQHMLQQQRSGDVSPVGAGGRQRSGSINSVGSGYGSPGSNASGNNLPNSYDVMNSAGGTVPRRMSGGGGHWDDGMMGMGGMGMMKSAPISVGGGGNGHGYAAMML
ncbi:hypothetical protein A0H81_10837 [Grifola frondosa]|uniref:BHLH domain-containing protein n=1 Tax=Grifola frondosa TaxID=5627 RepID=A0A1C7LY65_GRIFR|nr:hypothetical protein A0H81_10837 [Grifola frondosa]